MTSPKNPGRYSAPRGPEAEYQPGSGDSVLVNKLGIVDEIEMDRAEFDALVLAQKRFFSEELLTSTRFTPELIQKMHRDWLGGIYSWAGNYRSVNLSKGDFSWPPAHLVPQAMIAFDKEYLSITTPCLPGDAATVAMAIAKVHGELLFVHPFREGNGRLSRWVAESMALQAGWPGLEYGFVGENGAGQRDEYLSGVKRSYVGDYDRLARFFEAALLAGRESSAPEA